jgi:hypothetical protein
MIQVVTSLDFRGCEVTFFWVMLKVIIFGGSEVIFLGLLATSNQGIKIYKNVTANELAVTSVAVRYRSQTWRKRKSSKWKMHCND